eukprot:4562037-Ditylum_brightwellii.AAC.1
MLGNVGALYRLRSAGTSWRAALAEQLFNLGYKSTNANPDVWICLAVTDLGMEYYEILCVYVDGIVAVSSKARDAIQQVTEVFTAKEGSMGVLEKYLGTDIEKIQAVHGRMAVEDLFVEDGFDGGLKKKELNVTDEVGDHLLSRNGAHGVVSGKPKSRASGSFISHVCVPQEPLRHGNADWTDFYGDVKKELPPRMPAPRGHRVDIHAFVDANHAGN